jgi:hypothetical protein
MAGTQLTAADRRRMEAELAEYETYFGESDRASLIDERFPLSWVVSLMESLKLRTWHDRSYQDWKRLSEYVTRITFNRRLVVTLMSLQVDAVVGDEEANTALSSLPIKPRNPQLEFVLESHDNRRQLICRLPLVTGHPQGSYLNREELLITLGNRNGKSLGYRNELRLHFTNWQQFRLKPTFNCSVFGCISHHTVPRIGEIEQAYETQGVTGVWHALDRVWSDSLSTRPLVKPLSAPTLAVRCLVHHGHAVKVLTRNGPVVGHLVNDDQGMQPRDSIRLETAPGSDPHLVNQTRTITADDVLEILPWRLND